MKRTLPFVRNFTTFLLLPLLRPYYAQGRTIDIPVSSRQCTFYKAPPDPDWTSGIQANLHSYGRLNQAGNVQTCGRVAQPSVKRSNDESFDVAHCATFWEEVPSINGTVQRLLLQGCWFGTGNPECERSNCTSERRFNGAHLNETYMCCCRGDFCNSAFAQGQEVDTTSVPPGDDLQASEGWVTWAMLVGVALAGSLGLLLLKQALTFFRFYPGSDPEKSSAVTSGLSPVPVDEAKLLDNEEKPRTLVASVDPNTIQLRHPIGQGRYGSVFLGKTAEGKEVAVKVYQPKARDFFFNEVEAYQLPYMEHPGLLKLVGWGEVEKGRGEGTAQRLGPALGGLVSGNSENADGLAGLTEEDAPTLIREAWLLTAFHPRGNLQDHLKATTLSWHDALHMALTLSDALAYLHTPKTEEGLTKPAIAHRDLSSRNVLVKEDGSLVICDLGFALPLTDDFLHQAARDGHCLALNEVGTLRYMCPEILEGAVNLLDPIAALKAIDVYALGFILWEIISRCHDLAALLPGGRSGDYRPPLSDEIESPSLTMEVMQIWVCRRKVRPTLPQPLRKLNHQALRSLRELVEDSWDADAEARPSAICTHYRLREVANYTFESIQKAVNGAGEGGEGMRRESMQRPRPPSPGALQPYQGDNPVQERNLFHLSDEDAGSVGSGSLHAASATPVGSKPDPCSPLTLRLFLPTNAESGREKCSNAEREARNAAVAAAPARDRLLALLRAELQSFSPPLHSLLAPPPPTPPNPPPLLHQSASAKSIQLSHANRLFEDPDTEARQGLSVASASGSNHSSPELDEDASPSSSLCLHPLSSSSDNLPLKDDFHLSRPRSTSPHTLPV